MIKKICINDTGKAGYLTLYKKYNTYPSHIPKYISVEDDVAHLLNSRYNYESSRFMDIDDWRALQIHKIIGKITD
jgi:hypothetical protein